MTKSQYNKLFNEAAKHFNLHKVNSKVTKNIPNYAQFSKICDALIASQYNDISPTDPAIQRYAALNVLFTIEDNDSIDDLLTIKL